MREAMYIPAKKEGVNMVTIVKELFGSKTHTITSDAVDLRNKSFELMQKTKAVLDNYNILFKLEESQDAYQLNAEQGKVELFHAFSLSHGKEYNPNHWFSTSILLSDGYKPISFSEYPFFVEIMNAMGVNEPMVFENAIRELADNNQLSQDEDDVREFEKQLDIGNRHWKLLAVSYGKHFEAVFETEDFLY